MKKSFLFLGIFLALSVGFVAIAANKLLNSDVNHMETLDGDAQVDQLMDSSAEGMIRSLGALAVANSGTHVLEEKDGKVLLLVGLRVNLDSYVGQEATVRGRMSKTSGGRELLQVLSVDASQTSATPEDSSTADTSWTSFTNGSMGLSFDKRANWKQTLDSNKITFVLPLRCASDEQCVNTLDNQIVVDRVKKSDVNLSKSGEKPVQNKVGVDMVLADKTVFADGRVDFRIPRDDFYYIFSYRPAKKTPGDQNENDFYRLLSTFRFIPYY